MTKKRDRDCEFDARTKRRLADRAGHECSICRARTTGPSDEHVEAVNSVGVAAHIRGARRGSRRYDPTMSAADRSSIENGIWLCPGCGKKVDGDEKTWSLPALYRAKFAAEQRAKDGVGRRSRRGKGIRVTRASCSYYERFQAAFVYARVANEDSRGVTVESAVLMLGKIAYEIAEPIVSVRCGGRDLLRRPPIRLAGRDAIEGAWTFGGIADWPSGASRPSMALVIKCVGRTVKRYAIPCAGDTPGGSGQTPRADVADDGSIR